MFERFTDQARRVLVLAQEEARGLEHDFIGTEHLLLGILRHGEGPAPEALNAVGVTLEGARTRVAELVGPSGSPRRQPPPFTPRAKKTLEMSLREALQLGHQHIGTEHLLLGIIREAEGVGAQTVVYLGGDLSRVRQELISRIERPDAPTPTSPQPPTGRVWRGGRRVRSQPVGGDPPRCPNCNAPLADTARYRVLDVHAAQEGESGSAVISVTVVYCGRCGVALGTG
jgi:ATP-dependent Clp protease ATP-binding subunit ClpC